jgi:Domain of unknown function (DUF222)
VTLSELRRAMHSYATRFDADVISARDAALVVEDATAIENMAASVKALAAARVAETELWKKNGDRSAAHHLARTTGVSVGRAHETLTTARRLRQLPATSAEALSGTLSAPQTALIADAASVDPKAEARLLERSRAGSVGELRVECARTKAAACDLEERRRRVHEHRCLRAYTDAEGAGNLHMRDNPEVVAEVMAAIDPVRDELFNAARKEGRREPLEAYAADAMVVLSRRVDGANGPKQACRSRAKILVRVDLDALLRGAPITGETCELAGYGPIAVSAVRDLLDTGDPFLAAIATKGEAVAGVAHLGRRPRAHQQSALEWLYPICAVDGCNNLTFLEIDHRKDWAKTKITLLELLDRLCPHHHDLKTTEGWALVEGRGKRAFVPPDDPQHPRNAHGPPVAA